MFDFQNKTILITGGTGSIGSRLVGRLLSECKNIKKLIIFSRDEHKQFELRLHFPEKLYPNLVFLIGDIRDLNRLRSVTRGVDLIIHAAALKHVNVGEQNPMECIQTNIMGSFNLIEAAIENKVGEVLAVSSDKAAAPHNLYGATKFCADKLFTTANAQSDTKFSVVRFGNVVGSRGSVFEIFLRFRNSGTIPLTHPEMTRFINTPDQAIDWILNACLKAKGGEIWVPKIPSFRLKDLATAIAPNAKHDLIGFRQGEKMHEDLITSTDAHAALEFEDNFILLDNPLQHVNFPNGKLVPEGFNYSSAQNLKFLSVEELRDLVKRFVDPNFSI